ncbi:VOC family protein [Paraburkholderia phosphatilytica]|uniref:VOC family protein n=1 Tax=Paraburkholderia phosphatilytica TaxID=2282883 RepID=UPI000E53F276|nr:VOC family protein [Paraburkholderia phosphatilytica]
MLVQPYLFFDGRCEEALAFYGKTVGAQVLFQMRYKDMPPDPNNPVNMELSDKIMHTSFRIGDTELMASDGQCDGKQAAHCGYSLSLTADDLESAQKMFNALADGGKVTMPFAPTFWSKGFGMVADRFGVGWMVTVPHEGEMPQS